MAITVDRAKAIVTEFCRTFQAALNVDYRIRDTQEEMYGPEASKAKVGILYGGFAPAESQFHRGRCDFAVANIRDEDDFKRTLRHEVLGHFGINTYEPEEKQRILESIAKAKNQPGIRELWDFVDRHYPDQTELTRAEEVFSFSCEMIETHHRPTATSGESLTKALLSESALTSDDLKNIGLMVANRVRNRNQTPRTFPDLASHSEPKSTKTATPKPQSFIEQIKNSPLNRDGSRANKLRP